MTVIIFNAFSFLPVGVLICMCWVVLGRIWTGPVTFCWTFVKSGLCGPRLGDKASATTVVGCRRVRLAWCHQGVVSFCLFVQKKRASARFYVQKCCFWGYDPLFWAGAVCQISALFCDFGSVECPFEHFFVRFEKGSTEVVFETFFFGVFMSVRLT